MIDEFKGRIICASKYFTALQMKRIYEQGFYDFGENRVQDLLNKKSDLTDLKITWHFIGHLQTNKVKKVINEIDMLHTLDSLKLAKTIQTYRNRPLDCLIQLNLTKEEQKNGVFAENLPLFMNEIQKYDKINVVGLMTIGMKNDEEKTNQVFATLNDLAHQYQLPCKSMGMTEDYKIAVKNGATHLRIGRKFKELL